MVEVGSAAALIAICSVRSDKSTPKARRTNYVYGAKTSAAKIRRCGECEGCMRDDCGACVACEDKPRSVMKM